MPDKASEHFFLKSLLVPLKHLFHLHRQDNPNIIASSMVNKKKHISVANHILSSMDEHILSSQLNIPMEELDEMVRPLQHLLERDRKSGWCNRYSLTSYPLVMDVAELTIVTLGIPLLLPVKSRMWIEKQP